jgi:hypothetical protein
MGALRPIAQPMQFNRMQPPDDGQVGARFAPALFVTEMERISEATMRAMPEGVAWSIPAPAEHVVENRLIAGEYLNRLDVAVTDTLGQAAVGLVSDCRVVCKRSFDGALTVVVATGQAQALVDAIATVAPGVGAYFTLNPWEALEAATPTLGEAIEARAFWPVLKKMMGDGEDMSQPRTIRLCFINRQAGATGPAPDWTRLIREAEALGFTIRRHDGGVDMDAYTVLTGEEVNKIAGQVGAWIERCHVGFDGWEAENLLKQPE